MIYICIPTHNEQQTVGVVLWKLRQVLTDFPRDYQLLVADDASTDKTADVLEPYTRVLPLTVIRSERRLGYAGSLELLLREAVRRSEYPKRDVVIAMQADFSDEPDDVVALVKRLEAGADVAVGNKVSTARESRMRRFSRSVARFLARRMKWPEGVESPFDGYRAYRLYAVKKAMEERPDQRLIRYDGWTGHAELLRAVLPFARRVDVVNVDDRADRLQRPRREKPFASALQVRSLGSPSEPAGLVGVEELDRIAATASRSRDRAALSVRASGNGQGRRNGNRARERQDPGSPARSRGQGRTARASTRTAAERGGERQPRKREPAGERAARADRPQSRTRRERVSGSQRQHETHVAEAASEEQAPQALGGTTPAPTDVVEQESLQSQTGEAESRPKRKRRRRRRTGGQAAGESAGTVQEGQAEAEAGDGLPGEGEAGQAEAGEGQKKRRRRGGRRGGRGRRKPRTAGTESGEAPPEFASDAAAESAAHAESD